MRFKLLTSFGLIVVLVGVALAWSGVTVGFQSREAASIKVVVNQPPAKDGVIPIEIIQPTLVSSAPNKLDELTYILRNNSVKPVIAAAVMKTVTYDDGGKSYTHTLYSTMDAAFHSDMPGRPFLPGTQMSMESAGPLDLLAFVRAP